MKNFVRSNYLFIILSLLFFGLSVSFIFNSGGISCIDSLCTLHMAEWHMHDALWHLSLAKLSFDHLPFLHPLFSGANLHGYNYGLDLILYILMKVGIDPFFSFFQLLPVLLAILYIYSVYHYLQAHQLSPRSRALHTFFFYFGSSMSYLATLFQSGSLAGATLRGFPVVSSINPSAMFLNLQFSLSLSLLLILLTQLKKHPDHFPSLSLFLLIISLFSLKFYAGVIGLLLYFGLKSTWKLKDIIVALGATSIAYLIFYYHPSDRLPFSFAPFALTHLLIDDPLLFYNHNLTLARYYLYENARGFSPRLFAIELYSIILFALMNFGSRIVGMFAIFNNRHSREVWVLTLITASCFLIPVFFVQDGGWYNTMQFLYYGVWLSGILAARLLAQSHWLLVVIILILNLPNNLEQIRYPFLPQNIINASELKVYEYLKNSPSGVVHVNRPWAKRALIPVLSDKIPYYLDTDQLMVTHVDYQSRLDFILKYEGGSITTIPADYFLIYKHEVASPDSLRALSENIYYKLLIESPELALFGRSTDDTIKQ